METTTITKDEMELWYVSDMYGHVKNISKTHEDAFKFNQRDLKGMGVIGYAIVKKKDYDSGKINTSNIRQMSVITNRS